SLWRSVGNRSAEANFCTYQGHLLLSLGNYAEARARYEEAVGLRRADKDAPAQGWDAVGCGLLEVGHVAWLQGEPDAARSHVLEALERFRPLEDQRGILAAL